MSAVRSFWIAALPALACGCTLVADLDGYAGGVADAGVEDTSAAALDSAPSDTFAPDTSAVDTAAEIVDAALDAVADLGADTGKDTAAPPHRHTVAIDGLYDFAPASEKLSTTSAGYDAYVTWDDSAVFVGYVGADFGAGATPNKWLLVYIDADPGTSNGALKTEAYGAQQHQLPSGFAADAYFALKTDDSYQQLRRYGAGAWTTVAASGVTWKRNAASNFVEMRIPFAALGVAPTKLGVVTFMLDEAASGPWTYAGLFGESFVDGISPVATPKTIAHWLQVDLASPAAPNAVTNKRP